MKKLVLCLCFLLCGTIGARAVEFEAHGELYAFDQPAGYVGEENTMAKLMMGVMVEMLGEHLGVGALLFESQSLNNMFINPEGISYMMIAYDPNDEGRASPEDFAEFKAAFISLMSDDADLEMVTDFASDMLVDILGADMGFDMASATLVQETPDSISMYTTIAMDGVTLENPKFCVFSGQLVNGKVFFIYQYSDYGPDADAQALSEQALAVFSRLNLRAAGAAPAYAPAATAGANSAPSGQPTKSTRNAWR